MIEDVGGLRQGVEEVVEAARAEDERHGAAGRLLGRGVQGLAQGVERGPQVDAVVGNRRGGDRTPGRREVDGGDVRCGVGSQQLGQRTCGVRGAPVGARCAQLVRSGGAMPYVT